MLQTTEQLKLLDAARSADIAIIKNDLSSTLLELADIEVDIEGANTRWDANMERVTGAQKSVSTDHGYIHEGIAYNLSGVLTVAAANFGAIEFTPHAETTATITLDMTAASADLTFTAVTAGAAGNEYAVEVTTLGTPGAGLAVSYNPTTKVTTIYAGCDENGDISSTAADVKAAVNAGPSAAFIQCEDEGDGSGLVNVKAQTALAGGTNNVYVHLRASSVVANGGPVTITLLEDYTITAGGAAAIPVNRKRSGTVGVSSTAVKVLTDAAKTAGAGALTLDTLYLPAATQGVQRTSAVGGGVDEWVLRPGTHYMMSFANGAGSSSVVAYQLFWYEETGA